MEIKVLALEELVVSPFNTRKHCDEENLKKLAESIKQKGLIEPVVVRQLNGKYELICGERRFRASKIAGLSNIAARIVKLDDKEALEFQVIENLQREDIHPLEEAEGYEMLMQKHGYKSVEDIAAKVGSSKAYIYKRLKLCDLVPENRKLFYDETFSPSVALVVARVPKDIQAKAAKDLIENCRYNNDGISRQDAVDFISREFMLRLKEAPFDIKKDCAQCLKRTINEKELFADIGKEDRCTDPVCFDKHKNVHMQRLMEKVRQTAGDRTVLSLEDSKKALSYSNNTYVKLDDNCYDYSESKPYSELVKKANDVEVVYAIDSEKGKIIQLVNKKQLNEALKKVGMKSTRSAQGSDNALARKKERIRRAVIDKLISLIVENVRRDTKQTFLRYMAQSVLHHASFDSKRMMAQRHDPEAKGDKVYKSIEAHLKTISDSELLVFCVELLLVGENSGCYYGGNKYGESLPEICKHYNIDIKKIETQAEREITKPK